VNTKVEQEQLESRCIFQIAVVLLLAKQNIAIVKKYKEYIGLYILKTE
jgi:hypothetical protein